MVKMMMNEIGSDEDSGIMDQSTMMISIGEDPIGSSSFQENPKQPVGVPTVQRHHDKVTRRNQVESNNIDNTSLIAIHLVRCTTRTRA